jgi:two-component system chemotaxis response regulator CheY
LPSVIVVDDDEDCRCSLEQTLEMSGIEVLGTGADGYEAFQLYEKFLPDVVMLDLNMPVYDGTYAIEKIKDKYPDSKIVIVSAYMSDYKFDRNKVAGVLVKPYNRQELVKLIQIICSPIKLETGRFKHL